MAFTLRTTKAIVAATGFKIAGTTLAATTINALIGFIKTSTATGSIGPVTLASAPVAPATEAYADDVAIDS